MAYPNGRVPSANPYTYRPTDGEWSPYPDMTYQQDQIDRSNVAPNFARKLATGAVIGLGTAGLGSILGPAINSTFGTGGGAAATTAGTGARVGATATTGLSRLGSILSGRGFETAANLGLGVAGMVSQNRANSQARRDTLAASMKAIELEQQRLTAELRNADLDREDARALNAAIQELESKKFALMQEDSEFARSSEMWRRGTYEQEQARLEPARQASNAARGKLSSILGIG